MYLHTLIFQEAGKGFPQKAPMLLSKVCEERGNLTNNGLDLLLCRRIFHDGLDILKMSERDLLQTRSNSSAAGIQKRR